MPGNPLAEAFEAGFARLLPKHGGAQDPVGVWGLSEARLEGFSDALGQYVGARVGAVVMHVHERCAPFVWVRATHATLGSWSCLVAVW